MSAVVAFAVVALLSAFAAIAFVKSAVRQDMPDTDSEEP